MRPLRMTYLLTALLLAALLLPLKGAGQQRHGFWHQEWSIDHGDSIPLVHILPVYVFNRKVDLRRYRRLVDAVKKVYPIAQTAKAKMADMEEELSRLPTKKAQKEYIRRVYHEIKEEYTPVLRHMTRTQGACCSSSSTAKPNIRPTRCCANSAAASWRASGRGSRRSSGRTSSRSTTARARTA